MDWGAVVMCAMTRGVVGGGCRLRAPVPAGAGMVK